MLAYLAFAAVAAAADVAGAVIVSTVHKRRYAPLRYFVAAGAGFMLAAAFVRMLPEATQVPHAYLFVLLNWTKFQNIDLARWPNLAAFQARVGARPKVQEALQAEGLLKKAA